MLSSICRVARAYYRHSYYRHSPHLLIYALPMRFALFGSDSLYDFLYKIILWGYSHAESESRGIPLAPSSSKWCPQMRRKQYAVYRLTPSNSPEALHWHWRISMISIIVLATAAMLGLQLSFSIIKEWRHWRNATSRFRMTLMPSSRNISIPGKKIISHHQCPPAHKMAPHHLKCIKFKPPSRCDLAEIINYW